MGAVKIDGTAIAKKIRENLHAEIEEKKKINPRYIPSLKIIQGVQNTRTAAFLRAVEVLIVVVSCLQWATVVTLVSP